MPSAAANLRRYSFQSSPVSLRMMVFIAVLASSVVASIPIVLPRIKRCSWSTPRTKRKTPVNTSAGSRWRIMVIETWTGVVC